MTGDERATLVSDTVAIALLLGVAAIAAGTLGLGVLTQQDTGGPPEANFSFDYTSQSLSLFVTHDEGDAIPAGQIALVKGRTEATWAEVANVNASREIGPGDAIQLSRQSAFDEPIRPSDTVVVRWVAPDGNTSRRLDVWSG